MIIVVLALIGALAVTLLFGGLRMLFNRRSNPFSRDMFSWLLVLFVGNFVLGIILLYTTMPAFTGPYGGWDWLFWPVIISGALSLGLNGVTSMRDVIERIAQQRERFSVGGRGPILSSRSPNLRSRIGAGAGVAGVAAIVLVIVVGIVAGGIITVATTWFDPNVKALAAIPNIQRQPNNAQLPPTDVKHIVLVTQGIASYKGQQVLGQNGQNLGSKYHFEQSSYTLQSVAGHLYWIAPLVYNNIFANIGNYDTPGFVAVDAEDPNAQPQLRLDYHLHYVPWALLNQDLLRHVYLSGYTYGRLADPTLEVDDDWKPYFTISLMQPTRGFTGEVVKDVLLVDPQSGDIQKYSLNDVPAWVDRVIPADTVSQYLGWWGLYHNAPWFNLSGAGQEKTGSDPELVYNTADQPVWLVPMTSSAASDNSSTGIMLFDTKKNEARLYPLSGLGIGGNVQTTFASNPTNIRNYTVSSTQLYQIFGEPTWVGIFTQANSNGESFQAVGLVDARNLNGANVQMAPTLDQALSLYQQWLATRGTSSNGASSAGTTRQFTGKVIRVAPVTVNNGTSYYLYIEGQTHIFVAPLALSPTLPLVQPGDIVSGTYLDTSTTLVTLTAFSNASIVLPTSTATATP